MLQFTHNSIHDSDVQEGETALMKAACNGHVAIAEMLIEAGTDIHVQGQVTIRYNGYSNYSILTRTTTRTMSMIISATITITITIPFFLRNLT